MGFECAGVVLIEDDARAFCLSPISSIVLVMKLPTELTRASPPANAPLRLNNEHAQELSAEGRAADASPAAAPAPNRSPARRARHGASWQRPGRGAGGLSAPAPSDDRRRRLPAPAAGRRDQP